MGMRQQGLQAARENKRREVTMTELVDALKQRGDSPDDAERAAKFAAALGGSVLVGDELLSVKAETKDSK